MFPPNIILPHCARRPTFHFPKIEIEQPIKRQLRKQTLIFRPIQKNLQPHLASERLKQEFIKMAKSQKLFLFSYYQLHNKIGNFFMLLKMGQT